MNHADNPLLIRGGSVFNGSEKLPEHNVLVENGRIKDVAPASQFDGFQGPVLNADDATVMPGLIDCHVHLCLPADGDPKSSTNNLSDAALAALAVKQAQDTLRGGVTSLRDCGGRNFVEIDVRNAVRRGYFAGPNILASGRVVCMTGGHGSNWGRVADGRDEVIKAVREQIHAGCDFIKIMATGGVMTPGVNPEDAHYTEDELAAGISEGARFHKHAASHAQGAQGVLNATRAGVKSIEHGIFLNDENIEAMLQRGTYLVPTIAAFKGIMSNLDRVSPFVAEKTQRVGEAHKESFKKFLAAGGKFAMGTDAGTPFNIHGLNALEMEHMVEYGMSPLNALIAATSVAADLIELPDVGVVKKGARADLLVVNGDPTQNIAMAARTENHRAVLKNGVAPPVALLH